MSTRAAGDASAPVLPEQRFEKLRTIAEVGAGQPVERRGEIPQGAARRRVWVSSADNDRGAARPFAQ